MSFPEQPFGFVAGRWVLSIGDTPDDPDEAPDYVPVKNGMVVFTPQVTHRVAADGAGWAGIIKDRVSAGVGERGQLIDAEGHDHLALAVGVYLVSYDFGPGMSWPPHYIEVKPEHTVDAPLWLPPIAPPPEGPRIENRVVTIPADGEDGQVLVWDGAGFSWDDPPKGDKGDKGDIGPRGPVGPAHSAPAMSPRPQVEWVSTLQPGHGWTRPYGLGSLTDDPTVRVMGTQSLRVDSTAARLDGLALDLTDRDLVVLFRLEEITAGIRLIVQLSDDSGFSTSRVYRVLAGGAPSPWVREGEWVLATLPGRYNALGGEPDMSAITAIQIRADYETGSPSCIINLQAVGTTPARTDSQITISFDDGHHTTLEAARRAMSPRGMRGVAYVIPDLVDGSNAMTLDGVRELHQVHGWDVQAHALPTAPGRDPDLLLSEFRAIRAWITEHGFGTGEHFAWAGGQSDPASVAVARQIFTSARTIHDAQFETVPPAMPHRMRATSSIGGPGGHAITWVKGLIDQCRAEGGWLHLVFHRIVDVADAPEACSWTDFEDILDHITASGIPVRTVSEVLADQPPVIRLSQADYDALPTPRARVHYEIVGEPQ